MCWTDLSMYNKRVDEVSLSGFNNASDTWRNNDAMITSSLRQNDVNDKIR